MQTKEQMKNWKVVASVATVAALGISGLAVASPSTPSEAPPPIEIEDRRGAMTDFTTTTTIARDFEVVPGKALSPDHTLDSPLASADLASADLASADLDSPVTAPAKVDDSPDVNDSPAPAPQVDDSPDASVATPDASVATPDASVATPDVSADSPDSADSLDS